MMPTRTSPCRKRRSNVCASSPFLNQRVTNHWNAGRRQSEMIDSLEKVVLSVCGANFHMAAIFVESGFMSIRSQMFLIENCSNFEGKCLTIIILHGTKISLDENRSIWPFQFWLQPPASRRQNPLLNIIQFLFSQDDNGRENWNTRPGYNGEAVVIRSHFILAYWSHWEYLRAVLAAKLVALEGQRSTGILYVWSRGAPFRGRRLI